MLGVVTCHFNPNRYQRLRDNYVRFMDEINYPVTVVELAMDDDEFFCDGAIQIRGERSKHTIWQKERLLNVAIESLPPEVDNVAWIDADLLFMNKNWALDTERQLERFPVVQMFQGVVDLKSDGQFDRREIGWGYAKSIGDKEAQLGFRRPGGAWAFRRDVVKDIGLFDRGILGSGDAIQLFAWTADWKAWHVKQMGPHFQKQFLEWAWPHWERVKGDVGYIDGECIHLYHGTRNNRLYSERNKWLVESQFSFDDVRVDEIGLLTWNTNKPLLHQRLREYFPLRKEDDAG